MACLDVSHERSGDTCSARTRTHTFAHKPLQAVLAPLSVDFGRRRMNITLVMSSSITTTLIMGAGLAVGAAVADGELGSVMGSMLLNVHVPTTHTTSPHRHTGGVAWSVDRGRVGATNSAQIRIRANGTSIWSIKIG